MRGACSRCYKQADLSAAYPELYPQGVCNDCLEGRVVERDPPPPLLWFGLVAYQRRPRSRKTRA